MEKVLGIGGLFFRAKDAKKLAAWYETHLGIALTPTSYDGKPWMTEAGVTIFAPFAASSEYFGNPKQMWMVNFRVANLTAMVAQLTKAGIKVAVDDHDYPNGHFARLHDPEENPIELWEPKQP
jgi:glyoxylase I family protein